MMCSEMSSESQDLSGIFRYTVIRPRLKVVMSHFALFSVLNSVIETKVVKDAVKSVLRRPTFQWSGPDD